MYHLKGSCLHCPNDRLGGYFLTTKWHGTYYCRPFPLKLLHPHQITPREPQCRHSSPPANCVELYIKCIAGKAVIQCPFTFYVLSCHLPFMNFFTSPVVQVLSVPPRTGVEIRPTCSNKESPAFVSSAFNILQSGAFYRTVHQ